MAKTTTSPKQAPTQKTAPSVRKAPPTAARKAPRALPPALVANARALREAAQGRLKARGEAAVEIIKEKLTDISEHVLDIGMAARELMVTGVPEAMGHANFDALCAAELDLHPKTLQRWATLATRLKRQFVLSVGVGRAEALMELCDATPADDVPEDLVDATLVLPSGAKLVVKDATNEALLQAAQAFRHARSDTDAKRSPGFTTSASERKTHATIARQIAKAPQHAHAATRLVAQRDGDGPKVVLEARLPAWGEVVALLAKR